MRWFKSEHEEKRVANGKPIDRSASTEATACLRAPRVTFKKVTDGMFRHAEAQARRRRSRGRTSKRSLSALWRALGVMPASSAHSLMACV